MKRGDFFRSVLVFPFLWLFVMAGAQAGSELTDVQREAIAQVTERTGYELVEPDDAEEAYMAREIRGYPVILMGTADDYWQRWAVRVAAGEVGRELGGVWAHLTGSTEYGTGVTGSVFDQLLSAIMGQPITLTMLLHHNRPDTPRVDIISNNFPHRPEDLTEKRTRIGWNAGHLHTGDPAVAEAIAEDEAIFERLRRLRTQYLRVDSETVSFYFAGSENEYGQLISNHGDYFEMINELTELLADVADRLGEMG